MEKMQLKEMFGDGKRPTGADFAALIDALWANIESQLRAAMPVIRIKWARKVAPSGFAPGEYWYNTNTRLLYYMGEKKAEVVAIRYDVLYVVEEEGYMIPGIYVGYDGSLRLIAGEEL